MTQQLEVDSDTVYDPEFKQYVANALQFTMPKPTFEIGQTVSHHRHGAVTIVGIEGTASMYLHAEKQARWTIRFRYSFADKNGDREPLEIESAFEALPDWEEV